MEIEFVFNTFISGRIDMRETKIAKAFMYLVKENKPVPADAISSHLSSTFGAIQVGSTAIGSMMSDLRKQGCDVKRIYKGMNTKTGAQINLYHLLSYPEKVFSRYCKD
jgi:hypothetical protein